MEEPTQEVGLAAMLDTAQQTATLGVGDPAASADRGMLIGRYLVISKLGAGAMGVVFAAFDPELDRKVALKLLKHRGGDVGTARKRLQREAQSLAKLDHPNVVSVFDVGVHEGQLFVAMEFVEALAEQATAQAEQAKTQAEKSQKETERSVRQMFEVALRPVTERMVERGEAAGVVELDERWSPLLERGGQAIVAASMGASFRMVVAGHESVLSEADEDGRSLFLEITAQWLLADQGQRRVAIVTQQDDAYPRLAELEHNLVALEHEYDLAPSLADPDALAEVGMLILDNRQARGLDADEVATIAAFVDRGGGVLAVGHGLAWLGGEGHEDSEPSLENYPMNGALGEFGVRWTDATIDSTQLEQAEDAVVRFVNEFDFEVNLLTRSAGHEEYYTTLEGSESRELLTALGREWVFRRTADEQELGAVVIEGEEQVLRINEAMARVRPKPKPEPEPEPDKPASKSPAKLAESLSNEDMQAGLREARRAAKKCGEELETLQSHATVKVTVGADGTVVSATVLPPVKGTQEEICIEKAVAKLRFARTRQGGGAQWKLALW